MAQPTEPTNRQSSQPWARGRLRRTSAGLVIAAALWLSAAGTAFADHHVEPVNHDAGHACHVQRADFHPGRPGHDHQADFHPGRPGHDHQANHHGMP